MQTGLVHTKSYVFYVSPISLRLRLQQQRGTVLFMATAHTVCRQIFMEHSVKQNENLHISESTVPP